jgi:hypothetical protein
MASKRKNKKTLSESLLDEYDSDDSMKTSSSMATASTNALQMNRSSSQLSQADVPFEIQMDKCIGNLNDKRSSTREAALIKLLRSLSTNYMAELISPKMDQISKSLCRLLKKDDSESNLSCQVLSLLWITCGNNPDTFEQVVNALKLCVKNGSDQLKVTALNAMAIISYTEDVTNRDTWDFLEFFQDLIDSRDIDAKLVVSALNGYGLLYSKATTKPDREDFNMYKIANPV